VRLSNCTHSELSYLAICLICELHFTGFPINEMSVSELSVSELNLNEWFGHRKIWFRIVARFTNKEPKRVEFFEASVSDPAPHSIGFLDPPN
jgi:hypothetical protein